jgi:hypothetical protein
MKIISINTPEIPSPGNFIFTANKFLKGFEYNGFEVEEINSLDKIEQYNHKSNYFFLSNHLQNKSVIYDIANKLTNCVFICFHFNCERDIRDKIPFRKYIMTGEYYQTAPQSSESHLDVHNFNLSCKNFLPMTFSSSADPKMIGKLPRQDIYHSMFVGASYKKDWIDNLKNCFSHIGTSNFISESDRINAFLSSRVCLGFHSDANIMNGCVTERVFEGLSYGCVVVTDNIYATKITNGIVKYVSSFEELESIVNKANTDDNFFYETQNQGYEFAKKEGLYFHQAQKFIAKIEELYGPNI